MNENKYNELRKGIKEVHNINVALSNTLEDNIKDFESIEDLEVHKNNYLSFMLEVQDQLELLLKATVNLDILNKELILNDDEDVEDINPYNVEFRKKLLKGFED
ncbi:MAG: hypothetical protein ABGW74_02360 [Campylobacterales bacterium]